MRIVITFTFRVFGWVGFHARACYFLLRPVRVLPTLSTAFFAEPLAWSTRPSFLRCLFPVSAPAASFTLTFCLIGVLVGHGRPWLVEDGGSVRV